MMNFYPVSGTKYVIREWDNSQDKVLVLNVTRSSVRFQYDDGLTHEVSPDYFAFGLNATGIR